MFKKSFLMVAMLVINTYAMNDNSAGALGYTSINGESGTPSLLLEIKNKKAVNFLKEWQESKKTYSDWRREKTALNEEGTALLEVDGLSKLAEQIELLKKTPGIVVKPIFKDDVENDSFEKKYVSKKSPDNDIPLIIRIDGADQETHNRLKDLTVVAGTRGGTKTDIEKQVYSYESKIVGFKNVVRRVCCISGTSLAVFVVGAGLGILGTWLYMNPQQENQQSTINNLNQQVGCLQNMFNICNWISQGMCNGTDCNSVCVNCWK